MLRRRGEANERQSAKASERSCELDGLEGLECRAGGGCSGLMVSKVMLKGQDATEDTRDQKSEGGGMLDTDSPVWASDHRAVLAHLMIAKNPAVP